MHITLSGATTGIGFDYEKTISQLNSIIGEDIETVFLISKPEYSHISSTIVRRSSKERRRVSKFVNCGHCRRAHQHTLKVILFILIG